jgi:hypothetical protein
MHVSQIEDDIDTFDGKFTGIKRLSGQDGDRIYKRSKLTPARFSP